MSLWDPQQREWLQALGHPLWGLVGDEVEAEAEANANAPAAVPAAVGMQGVEPADILSSPARRSPERPPLPPSPAPPPRARTDLATKMAALESARLGATREADGPLREALLRATGQLPAVAARTLRELGVDQAVLRDDPIAKRALWRQLRPVRKAAR